MACRRVLLYLSATYWNDIIIEMDALQRVILWIAEAIAEKRKICDVPNNTDHLV